MVYVNIVYVVTLFSLESIVFRLLMDSWNGNPLWFICLLNILGFWTVIMKLYVIIEHPLDGG